MRFLQILCKGCKVLPEFLMFYLTIRILVLVIEILRFFFVIWWSVACTCTMHESKQLKNNLNEMKYSGESVQTSVENTCRKVSRDSIYK